MKAIEKFIPNFSRYVINKKGEIKNHLTGTLLKRDSKSPNRVVLRNDSGKNEGVFPEKLVETLFAKPAKAAKVQDPYKVDTTKIEKQPVQVPGERTRNLKKYDFDSMSAEERSKIHASNKLTTADVHRIRYLLDNKINTNKEIGVMYGMTQQNAGRIKNRKIYTDIPEQNEQG